MGETREALGTGRVLQDGRTPWPGARGGEWTIAGVLNGDGGGDPEQSWGSLLSIGMSSCIVRQTHTWGPWYRSPLCGKTGRQMWEIPEAAHVGKAWVWPQWCRSGRGCTGTPRCRAAGGGYTSSSSAARSLAPEARGGGGDACLNGSRGNKIQIENPKKTGGSPRYDRNVRKASETKHV